MTARFEDAVLQVLDLSLRFRRHCGAANGFAGRGRGRGGGGDGLERIR